jgi:hypothetical protein
MAALSDSCWQAARQPFFQKILEAISIQCLELPIYLLSSITLVANTLIFLLLEMNYCSLNFVCAIRYSTFDCTTKSLRRKLASARLVSCAAPKSGSGRFVHPLNKARQPSPENSTECLPDSNTVY